MQQNQVSLLILLGIVANRSWFAEAALKLLFTKNNVLLVHVKVV